MPRADAPPPTVAGQPQQRKKVSLLEFMWHEHSLLGLLAPDNHVPPPIKPCCCCCVFTDALSRRHRIFIFVFVLALSTALAVQVSLGQHNSLYALAVLIFCVTPCTCHLKSNLPTYSGWLLDRKIGPIAGLRLEELALLGGIAYAVVSLWQSMRDDQGLLVLGHALTVWGGTLVSELMCLPAKYCFGRACCCCCDCCVPQSYLLDDDDIDIESHHGQQQQQPGGTQQGGQQQRAVVAGEGPTIARMEEPLLR
jgi:hypothetical protein